MWMVRQFIAWFLPTVFLGTALSVQLLIPGRNGNVSFANILNLGPDAVVPTCVIVFGTIYFAYIFYTFLLRANYSFEFLPDYIVIRSGLFLKKETHLPYQTNVLVSQGIIERPLGIATVRIGSVVSNATIIPGQPLAKANEISDAIKRIALTKNSSQTGL